MSAVIYIVSKRVKKNKKGQQMLAFLVAHQLQQQATQIAHH